MKEVYLDNSATTMKKPDEVVEAVKKAMLEYSFNSGRAGYRNSLRVHREIYEIREKISDFFNVGNPLNVAFTANGTESLNFAILGGIEKGSHVITTYFEHNSVLRPLFLLQDRGDIEISFIETYDEIEEHIQENTKAIVINHISNVNGTVQNIYEIGKIAKNYNLKFILDASQSAGIESIDMERDNIDILCFTGHKGLYGIQGIGAICLKNGNELQPILEGGTGSFSKMRRQPLCMPEMLEAGTVNTPGIFSLGAGIDFINRVGLKAIKRKEKKLMEKFIKGLEEIKGIKIYKSVTEEQGNVVSVNMKNLDAGELGNILDEEFNIMTRAGFHCAPIAHNRIGTYETGTVRFSLGYFNNNKDIESALKALKEISDEFYVEK